MNARSFYSGDGSSSSSSHTSQRRDDESSTSTTSASGNDSSMLVAMESDDDGSSYNDSMDIDSDDTEYYPSESESSDSDMSVGIVSADSDEESDDDGNDDTTVASVPAWSDDCGSMKSFSFTANTGLNLVSPDMQTPYDFFCLFVNDAFYELLVRETNHQARCLLQNRKTPKSRITSWKDLSVSELKGFLGLLLHMGHIPLSRLADYWKTDKLFNLKCFSEHMSRNRFLLILRCLHFSRNPDTGEALPDRLYKIKPLLDHFNSTMEAIYYPNRELSIDESMVLWRGRLVFRQYIKNKRHKYGIKLYQLTESSGLVLKTLVYCGSLDSTGGKGHSENVVLHLMEGKLDKGHALYMDNFYNSQYLASLLLDRHTYCTGTLRKNRKNNPPEVLQAKLKKGERKCQFSDGVLVTKWKDKRDVLVISNEHKDEMVDVANRRRQISSKPLAVARYNQFMSGIDRKDQMLAYYPCERKTLRWYIKLGIYLIQTMTLNSFYLYQKCCTSKMTYYDYRLSVIRKLLSLSSRLAPREAPPKKNDVHASCKLKTNASGKTMRKRCRVCNEEGRRRDTQYYCESCPQKPALCVDNCFKKYHDK